MLFPLIEPHCNNVLRGNMSQLEYNAQLVSVVREIEYYCDYYHLSNSIMADLMILGRLVNGQRRLLFRPSLPITQLISSFSVAGYLLLSHSYAHDVEWGKLLASMANSVICELLSQSGVSPEMLDFQTKVFLSLVEDVKSESWVKPEFQGPLR